MGKKSVIMLAKTLLSIFIMFVGIIGGNIGLQLMPGDQEWTLLATPFGIALSAVLMYSLVERKREWSIGLKDTKWAGRLLSGGTTAAVIVSTSTAIIFLTDSVQFGVNAWSWSVVLFQLMLFLAVALSEELLFRGYLYGLYQHLVGTRVAIIINSVIFTGIHLFNPHSLTRPIEHIVLEIVNIFLISILISQARAFSGTLWLPISLHFMFNFFQSTVFGFANGGKEVESISWISYVEANVWNGAGYGLESSLILTPMLIISIVVYGYYRKRTAAIK